MTLIENIDKNKRQTKVLIFTFIILLTLLGFLIGIGLSLALELTINQVLFITLGFLILSIIYSLFSFFMMKKMITKSSRGILITDKMDPELIHIVEDMAMMANVPMPEVYIIEDDAPNAFASGRDPEHSMIAITTGLRNLLARDELEGVIAHEMAHIKNYDIQITTLSVALVSFVVGAGAALVTVSWYALRSFAFSSRRKNDKIGTAILGIAIVFLLIGWIIRLIGIPIAKIIQFALSREREYLADATGAELTQNPEGLIKALTKINNSSVESTRLTNSSISALYISKPKSKDKQSFFMKMYKTHPDTNDRITRLKNLM